jgi:hypothetical protein
LVAKNRHSGIIKLYNRKGEIFIVHEEHSMRILLLLTTAMLAIALYGCTTDKTETIQEKTELKERKLFGGTSKAKDPESITSDSKKKRARSARKTRTRKSSTSKRNYARRDYPRRDYDDRDYSDRQYTPRDYDDRGYSDKQDTGRDYADRTYSDRQDSSRGYDDRSYDTRDDNDRNYDRNDYADVGSRAAAGSAARRTY